jgi:hypothetical protein
MSGPSAPTAPDHQDWLTGATPHYPVTHPPMGHYTDPYMPPPTGMTMSSAGLPQSSYHTIVGAATAATTGMSMTGSNTSTGTASGVGIPGGPPVYGDETKRDGGVVDEKAVAPPMRIEMTAADHMACTAGTRVILSLSTQGISNIAVDYWSTSSGQWRSALLTFGQYPLGQYWSSSDPIVEICTDLDTFLLQPDHPIQRQRIGPFPPIHQPHHWQPPLSCYVVAAGTRVPWREEHWLGLTMNNSRFQVHGLPTVTAASPSRLLLLCMIYKQPEAATQVLSMYPFGAFDHQITSHEWVQRYPRDINILRTSYTGPLLSKVPPAWVRFTVLPCVCCAPLNLSGQ